MGDRVGGQGKLFMLAVGLASAAVVGILDYLTGAHVTLAAVYLLPIGLAAWTAGAEAGILVSLAAAAVWLAAHHYAGHRFASLGVMTWQLFSLAATAAAFSILLARLRKAEERTQALSLVDFATGALNSRAFYTILENEHRKSTRYGRPLTLVYMGLDDFKRVNDRFGHTVGDSVLLKVARTTMRQLRATDRVARLGGDEFAIMLPETGRESAKNVIPKICQGLAEEMAENRWPLTMSVAVVTFARVPASARAMLKTAEKLMRTIKKDGKNAVRYATYNG